jgi:hypothetical protein
MNTITTILTTIIIYLSIIVGSVAIIYFLTRAFIVFLNYTFKKFKILKYVMQFFYHREDFFKYLKNKYKHE